MDRNNQGHIGKPRLWMKFDRRDEGSATLRTPELQQKIVYQPPPRARPPKKGGATGLGFRLNVTVCPKVDQIFLAFSTILLIVSLDLLVLTIVNVGPGMLSRKFSPATCKIVEKKLNYSSFCYVNTLDKDHGKHIYFKCLQIYVTLNSYSTSSHDVTTKFMTSQHAISISGSPQEKFLLYQNEFHLVGGDYKNRPCSFLPDYCTGNQAEIDQQVMNYSRAIGDVSNEIECQYSTTSGLSVESSGVVMRYRIVTLDSMVHSLIWPLFGVFVSIFCCSAFWKKNHHRTHRLFIYNAWSPS